MNAMNNIILRLRQLTYPPEFRLEIASDEEDWGGLFGALMHEAMESAAKAASQSAAQAAAQPPQSKLSESAPAPATAAVPISENPALTSSNSAALPEDFVLGFCNAYFRLQKNARLMEAKNAPPRELRGITLALQKISGLLEAHEIECRDLGGELYDDGRADFMPLGPPEESPDVQDRRIGICETPAVFLRGKLLQPAKGIVQVPPRSQSSSS